MPSLYKPSRALISTGTSQDPEVKTKHGIAGFSYYAAHRWNKLPTDLTLARTLGELDYMHLTYFIKMYIMHSFRSCLHMSIMDYFSVLIHDMFLREAHWVYRVYERSKLHMDNKRHGKH